MTKYTVDYLAADTEQILLLLEVASELRNLACENEPYSDRIDEALENLLEGLSVPLHHDAWIWYADAIPMSHDEAVESGLLGVSAVSWHEVILNHARSVMRIIARSIPPDKFKLPIPHGMERDFGGSGAAWLMMEDLQHVNWAVLAEMMMCDTPEIDIALLGNLVGRESAAAQRAARAAGILSAREALTDEEHVDLCDRLTNSKMPRAVSALEQPPGGNRQQPSSEDNGKPARIEFDAKEYRVRLDATWYTVGDGAFTLLKACWESHPTPVFASHLEGDVRPCKVKQTLPRQLREILRSQKGKGCWLEL